MSDVSFIPRNGKPYCDMDIVGGDILFGDEIQSLIYTSIMTDARVTPDEYSDAKLSVTASPNNVIKLRGWWGDSYSSIPGNSIGSKIWLNSRQKATTKVLQDQIQYVEEALEYLETDGVASDIGVTAEWTEEGRMDMGIKVSKPDGTLEEFRYQFAWEGI